MRLNEQRDTLAEAIEEVVGELGGFRAAVLRKMAAPYGDGSRSNMVNAETDVLPRIEAILRRLELAADEVGAIKRRPPQIVEAVRIW